MITNKVKEANGLINKKDKYPIVKKNIFSRQIYRLVKKKDLFFFKSMWCKWTNPAWNKFLLFFNLIKLSDKNSKTKIEIDHASKIGWTIFWFAKYIKVNDIINPNNKLPRSPRNNFGSLNTEKLKNKKNIRGSKTVIKNSLVFSSVTKKYKIPNTEIVVKLSIPSKPSK